MRPLADVTTALWRDGRVSAGARAIAEERAIAFTYNGGGYAVMMATPQDLDDFACGFSLAEGIVSSRDEIERIEIVEDSLGIELRLWLGEARANALGERRRRLAGPTGCGLCGIESLDEAMRPPRTVASTAQFRPADIMAARDALESAQALNRATHAVHAAAFWSPAQGLVAVREDVGRHNALDKLAGALARLRTDAGNGFILLTSRVSVEMIQKSAVIGAPMVVAVSAPTTLAVEMAEAAGITLVGVARHDGFEVFTHPDRISDRTSAHEVRAHVV